MLNEFRPAWWLNNRHLQTIYPALLRRALAPIGLHRERLETPDGDFVDLDWLYDQQPRLAILLHGLAGSSGSGYIVGLQRRLHDLGIGSVALNFRGCSGEMNRLARCYHSGDTEDLDFLYRTLRRRLPDTALAAVGFSLGGNVLLKWLGERRDSLELFGAVAVSVPLMLNLCADRLDSGLSRIYRDYLLRELKQYIAAKRRYLRRLGRAEQAGLLDDLGDLAPIRSFWEYDDRVVARLHGFSDAHDYYQSASSRQFLRHIGVPTLILQAEDDPFMTPAVLPAATELAAGVTLQVCAGGGHVGFVGGRLPWRPVFWLEQRIGDFLLARLPENRGETSG